MTLVLPRSTPPMIGRRRLLALGTALALPMAVTKVWANGPLLIGQASESRDQMISTRFIEVIYARLGIAMTTVELPSRRAIAEAQAGKLDGLTHRIYELGEECPSLIRVPTPISSVQPSLFTNRPDLNLTDLESIRPYRVGIRRGARLAEIRTKDMKNVIEASTPLQSVQLLDRGLLDVVILSRENGLYALREAGISTVTMITPALATLDVFHYLHESHRDLVPRVDEAIWQMRDSGEHEALRAKFFEDVVGLPYIY